MRVVVGLEDLPAKCLAHRVSQTSPVDACRLALVSPTLRSAADSDDVWDKFLLLSDYKSMVVSLSNDDASLSSKKDLFLRLCHNPVLIEHAKKSFWLDKWSGKRCHMISAREFEITGSEIPHSRTWINLPESRFEEAAELLLARRLQIQWKMDTAMLSPATNYAAYLVLKWRSNNANAYSMPGSRLWTSIVCSEPEFEQRPNSGMRRFPSIANIDRLQHPRRRKDGWMEIVLGDYFHDKGDDGQLKTGVVEVTNARGLILQGIEIRPLHLILPGFFNP